MGEEHSMRRENRRAMQWVNPVSMAEPYFASDLPRQIARGNGKTTSLLAFPLNQQQSLNFVRLKAHCHRLSHSRQHDRVVELSD